MLIVEIDVIHLEAAQAPLDGGFHVLGATVDAALGRIVRMALDAELGGEKDVVAASLDGLAHQLLVGERSVHVGRVEEGEPEVEGAMDGRDRFHVIARAVELAHPHATEAESGNRGAVGAKRAGLHRDLPECVD